MIKGTCNVRTLKNNNRLEELESAFNNFEIQILGLAETRRQKETIIITKSKNLLYHSGGISSRGKVGSLIKLLLKEQIVEIRSISNRIAKMIIKVREVSQIIVIEAYSPTSTEAELEKFYDRLTETINSYIHIHTYNGQ